MLTTEFQYFIDHQSQLVEKFSGKYLVIVGEEVVGAYDTIEEAYQKPQDKYELGSFYIQQAIAGEESYTHIINRYSY